MRQLQPGLEITLPPRIGFGVHHFEQEVGIGGFLLRRALQQAFEPAIDGRQAESGECGTQLFNGSHSAPPQATLS
jgi:hypothetical protein